LTNIEDLSEDKVGPFDTMLMIISEINSFLDAPCTEQHSSTTRNSLQVFIRQTTLLLALLF